MSDNAPHDTDVELSYIQDFAARAQAAQEAITKLGAGPKDLVRLADMEEAMRKAEVVLLARIDQLENALKWIYQIAGEHYMGQAFEPDHMRALANLAADALAEKDLPDHDESSKRAREQASELVELLLKDMEE